MLIENGGSKSCQSNWADRFYKRWSIRRRVATTKMREVPADLENKKNIFINVGAALIREFNVPKYLVINCDETGVLFVPRAKFTYAVKGTKKVRLFGVGKGKAQITCTIAATETGETLKTQMLYEGTTNRCHPTSNGRNIEAPPEVYFDHTKSHWQTPASYIRY